MNKAENHYLNTLSSSQTFPDIKGNLILAFISINWCSRFLKSCLLDNKSHQNPPSKSYNNQSSNSQQPSQISKPPKTKDMKTTSTPCTPYNHRSLPPTKVLLVLTLETKTLPLNHLNCAFYHLRVQTPSTGFFKPINFSLIIPYPTINI